MPITATELLRIVVADDHPVYRDGIVRALETSGRFEVAGEAADGATAARVIAELRPDVALLDMRMPGLDALGVLRRLREQHIDVPVLLLTAFTQQEIVERVMDAGAAGYLSKDAPRDEILDALELAALGGRVQETATGHAHGWPPLERAERALLQLLRDGWGVEELPALTGLDADEIDRHLLDAAVKLGTRHIHDTIERAAAHGLLEGR